jgi:hypothetical protein
MKNSVNNHLRQLESIQERQWIINELKKLEVASTVSLVNPRENHSDSSRFFQGSKDIFWWLEHAIVNSSISESAAPITLLDTVFDNSSVLLSIEDSDSWIPTFFKESFVIKAKIKTVEKAHFKIFTP